MTNQAPRNEAGAAVPKFCLTLETYRRTQEGRVRTPQEFLAHFFPYDEKGATDRIFKHLPSLVRGPMLTAWGLRAQKSALRDTDEKVRDVVHDALVAGDLDATQFEEGFLPETIVRWLPLTEWWTFWRGGKLAKPAISKALDAAFTLGFFDAKLFIDSLEGGKAKGTDVIGAALTKDELLEWVREIYEGGDASATGVLAAIGWDKALQKTSNASLLSFLDTVTRTIGLTPPVAPAPQPSISRASGEPPAAGWDVSEPPPNIPSQRPVLQLSSDEEELVVVDHMSSVPPPPDAH